MTQCCARPNIRGYRWIAICVAESTVDENFRIYDYSNPDKRTCDCSKGHMNLEKISFLLLAMELLLSLENHQVSLIKQRLKLWELLKNKRLRKGNASKVSAEPMLDFLDCSVKFSSTAKYSAFDGNFRSSGSDTSGFISCANFKLVVIQITANYDFLSSTNALASYLQFWFQFEVCELYPVTHFSQLVFPMQLQISFKIHSGNFSKWFVSIFFFQQVVF